MNAKREQSAIRIAMDDVVPGLCPDTTWGARGGLRERSEQGVPTDRMPSEVRS